MSRKITKAVCKCCGTIFYARSPLAELCSKRCSNVFFRAKETPTQADLQREYELQQSQQGE